MTHTAMTQIPTFTTAVKTPKHRYKVGDKVWVFVGADASNVYSKKVEENFVSGMIVAQKHKMETTNSDWNPSTHQFTFTQKPACYYDVLLDNIKTMSLGERVMRKRLYNLKKDLGFIKPKPMPSHGPVMINSNGDAFNPNPNSNSIYYNGHSLLKYAGQVTYYDPKTFQPTTCTSTNGTSIDVTSNTYMVSSGSCVQYYNSPPLTYTPTYTTSILEDISSKISSELFSDLVEDYVKKKTEENR